MKKSTRNGLIENIHCSIIDVGGASYFLQELDILKIPLTEDEILMKEVIEESRPLLLCEGLVEGFEFPEGFFEELDDIREGLVISLELRGVV